MGVPSFYRWLVTKYPKILTKAKPAATTKEDTTSPNPNGIEFDNLYLDLNGIIHPCFHPDTHTQMFPPKTYEDVFENIYEYIDLLFSIVRPRKLLFLAIDGVAPRAKRNQQRSRRYQTSKDKKQADGIEERLRKEFEVQGKQVLPKLESQVSDSNVITPGTEFMYKLSEALKVYVCLRLKNDPAWRNLKVILSDSNVPGEGEHKIMSFIHAQRGLPDYDPNTKHCLYGLDADLIMLALATHEVHFSILREDVLLQEQQSRFRSATGNSISKPQSSVDSGSTKSSGWFKQSYEDVLLQEQQSHFRSATGNSISKPQSSVDSGSTKSRGWFKQSYEFLHIWILREYLELDMTITNPPKHVQFDLERVIDDFLFMCFFAGNDFLPHMPSLEIHEGAIDLLMTVYKEEFNKLGGYLVDMQKVDQRKACYIKLSRVEKFILKVGTYEEKIFKKRSEVQECKLIKSLRSYAYTEDEETAAAYDLANLSLDNVPFTNESNILQNTEELKERLKKTIREESDLFKNSGPQTDKMRLGATGWKERYYKQKLSAKTPEEIEALRKEITCKYTEGLLWVLCYYFSGVPSWTWFYPYHYGPFASDMRGISQVTIKFRKGVPFKPFDQLMSVLPPMSANALPKAYQALMLDEQSRIIDFYSNDFEVDTDGKRYAWQGICKLPFIDEERLLAETRLIEKELTEEESIRNRENMPHLFAVSSGCSSKDDILCVPYELPNDHRHVPRLLQGVILPDKVVFENDITATELWHEKQVHKPNTRKQHDGRDGRERSGLKITSTKSSSPHTVCKEGGHGWLGHRRGQWQSSQQQIEGNFKPSPFGRGASLRQDQWKAPVYSHYERKSESTQSSWSSGRSGAQGNNNFWPSRDGTSYDRTN